MGFILGAHQNLETQAASRCGYGDVVLRNKAALLVKLRKGKVAHIHKGR